MRRGSKIPPRYTAFTTLHAWHDHTRAQALGKRRVRVVRSVHPRAAFARLTIHITWADTQSP